MALSTGLQTRLGQSEQGIGTQLATSRTEAAQGRKDAEEALGRHVEAFSGTQATRLHETNQQMKELRERTEAALTLMQGKVEALNKEAGERQEAMREQIRTHLELIRTGNETKLDEMKGVVDEKLSATLEARLGEKFATVSERLEAVHKGLGEMQALATDVGGLKRVLTNVKARGGFGELRLGQLLGDMLTPDQYEKQVAVRAGAGERVDFAIKLPGRTDNPDKPLWLPIDCKFPQEDFERLQAAQDGGDAAEVEARSKDLEKAVRIQAKSIGEKYVQPPHTTDFAILYLPTEGLVRRGDPAARAGQRPAGQVQDHGDGADNARGHPQQPADGLPARSTIEKRSSEVWEVLRRRQGRVLQAVRRRLGASSARSWTPGQQTAPRGRSPPATAPSNAGCARWRTTGPSPSSRRPSRCWR